MRYTFGLFLLELMVIHLMKELVNFFDNGIDAPIFEGRFKVGQFNQVEEGAASTCLAEAKVISPGS
jgi:hypothetical protein